MGARHEGADRKRDLRLWVCVALGLLVGLLLWTGVCRAQDSAIIEGTVIGCKILSVHGRWERDEAAAASAGGTRCRAGGTDWVWSLDEEACAPQGHIKAPEAKDILASAKSRWVVVTGDSIARLFFKGLLRTLGMHREAAGVVKQSLGYVFHTTANGTTPLSVAYIGSRYPAELTAISSAWGGLPGKARVWNNATNEWAEVPQPNVWVANAGLHAMLYQSNDTKSYRHALGALKKRASELLPLTTPFWLGLPSLDATTMPSWKASSLSPLAVTTFEDATLPALLDADSPWRLLTSRWATATLPIGLAPVDGIHGESSF
jgi:hypothetical protein